MSWSRGKKCTEVVKRVPNTAPAFVTLGLRPFLRGEFSPQVGRHQLPDVFCIVGQGKDVHEFGEGRLGGHVPSRDDATAREHVAGGVSFRMNATMPRA